MQKEGRNGSTGWFPRVHADRLMLLWTAVRPVDHARHGSRLADIVVGMTAAELPTMRLTSPGEIAAAVPHLCGFVPTESLVAISLRGPRRRIGLTLRLDLPPDGNDDELRFDTAEQIAARLAHDRGSAAVLVVFTEEADREQPRAELVRAVIDAIEQQGMTVMEALLVRAGHWSSYTCRQPSCCPVEGTPISAAGSVDLLAATAAYDGRVVLRDRAELVASVAPPVLLAAEAAAQRLDAAMTCWVAAADERGRAALHREAVASVRDALSGDRLSERALAALAVSLQDVAVRDEVGTMALEDSEALLTLLLTLARQTVAPYDVPICTLVALVAWVRGDGALGNVALDRALTGDPSYNMAKLLRAGLDGQLPPSAVKQWLRETRRAVRAS
jgi:hypothetical protein